jgi:hypothetical protein
VTDILFRAINRAIGVCRPPMYVTAYGRMPVAKQRTPERAHWIAVSFNWSFKTIDDQHTRHRGSRQRAVEREDVAVTSIIARGLWVQLAQRRLGFLQHLSIWLMNTFGCDVRFLDLNVGRLYRPVAIVIRLMPTVY